MKRENLYQKDRQKCIAAKKRWFRRCLKAGAKWDADIEAMSVAFQEKYGIFYEQKWFDCAKACNLSHETLDEACQFCIHSSHRERCGEKRTCKWFAPFYEEKDYEPSLFNGG